MKARITILIGAVALVTLSFTFATTEQPNTQNAIHSAAPKTQSPIGGMVSDVVVQ